MEFKFKCFNSPYIFNILIITIYDVYTFSGGRILYYAFKVQIVSTIFPQEDVIDSCIAGAILISRKIKIILKLKCKNKNVCI